MFAAAPAAAAAANRRRCPAACRRRLLPRLQPRFQVILLCFLATLTAYVERVGFSIAWTGMCSQVGGWPPACLWGMRQLAAASSYRRPAPTLQAGVEEGAKGAVLSAFYWGYAVSQARAGRRGCSPPNAW